MTGPDHYRKAEELLGQAATDEAACHYESATARVHEAQVHATLALTAATAMQAAVDGSEPGMGSAEFHKWYQAAGVKPQPKGGTA
ncbi:hypothetical protein [Streptomyces sp. NPDC056948]|uniref:hypothetical protein n=1 Tax=Streptomyces sp. NPDC056948 TaxID=3345975 RepID=UPI00364497CC